MIDKLNIADVEVIIPEASDLQEIGSGGYKIVYKAQVRGKTEAVKLVQIPSDENDSSVREENLRRIRREIAILGKCETSYLVKLGSIPLRECRISSNEYALYSEEHVSGKSLRNLIQIGNQPTIGELTKLARCLLRAVQDLVKQDIIHRDIKPDNVIETKLTNRPYVLLDLGIAFQIGGTQITRDRTRIPGTLYYIAPEMLDCEFRQNLDFRADLYDIGLTLYEYASSDNPFAHRRDPQYTTLYRIKTETPKPLSEHRPDLPMDFCVLVDQLLKKLPALRPSNISMLIKRMEEFQ